MTRAMMVAVLLLAVGALLGCEAAGEKPAQEALAQVRVLRASGNQDATRKAARVLATGYPQTKAAQEAKKISDEVEAEISAELDKEIEKLKKERADLDAKLERVSAKIRSSKDLLAKLNSRYDDMKQIAWYKAKGDSLVLGSWLRFYFGTREYDGKDILLPLRMVIQLQDEEWVFAKKAILKVDGKTFEIEPDNWRHENSSGTIWESADLPLSESNPTLLGALAQGNEVKIRFDGRDRVRDISIPPGQLVMAKQVFAVWQEINSVAAAKN